MGLWAKSLMRAAPRAREPFTDAVEAALALHGGLRHRVDFERLVVGFQGGFRAGRSDSKIIARPIQAPKWRGSIRDGGFEVGDGLVILAVVEEQHGAAVPDFGIVRLDGDGLVEGVARAIEPSSSCWYSRPRFISVSTVAEPETSQASQISSSSVGGFGLVLGVLQLVEEFLAEVLVLGSRTSFSPTGAPSADIARFVLAACPAVPGRKRLVAAGARHASAMIRLGRAKWRNMRPLCEARHQAGKRELAAGCERRMRQLRERRPAGRTKGY